MQTLVQKFDDFCWQIDLTLINVQLQYWPSQGVDQARTSYCFTVQRFSLKYICLIFKGIGQFCVHIWNLRGNKFKENYEDIFHVGIERNPERAREIFLEKRGVFNLIDICTFYDL